MNFLGNYINESKERASGITEGDLSVYGVDRTAGLTPNAKYQSKDTSNYKVIRPGMFAYNPMRLNIGSIAFCTSKNGIGLVSPDYVVFRCKKSVLDPVFLSHVINGPAWQHWTTGAGVGSVRIRIYYKELATMPFDPPPYPEQKAIAHILGSLDDKIELNRRINETLEGMAQTLFKSWFVDFDPVIDNALAAGNPIPEELAKRAQVRSQALANGTANREAAKNFPDAFQLTEEMGWIPEGWEAKPLGEVASILNGYAFKSGDYIDSGIFVLRTKNFDANGLSSRRTDDVFLPESFAESHDTYLSQPFDFHLVMVGASIGKTSLLLPHMLPALRNQNMWCFRPTSDFLSRTFLNLAVQKKVEEVMMWASGSARSFFRKSDFKNHEILIPSDELLLAFENIAGPMFLGVSNKSAESETLSKLRDTLLPKLISGELRIEDAEKLVKAI
jgi:type I restriction enzyme, S subunit